MTLEQGKRYILKSEAHELTVVGFSVEPNVGRVAVTFVSDLGHTGDDTMFEIYRTDGKYYWSGEESDRDVLRELPPVPKPVAPVGMRAPTGLYSKSGIPLDVRAPKSFVKIHGWPETRIQATTDPIPEGYMRIQFTELPDE